MEYSNMNRRVICILFSALVFLLAVLPRPALAEREPELAFGDRIIVSLGDSYASGEGIEEFYGQDQNLKTKASDPDWLAHRSQKSWSGMLTLDGVGRMSEHRNENWFFAASSGATTAHIRYNTTKLNEKDENYEKKAVSLGYQRKDVKQDGYSNPEYIDPQLNVFDRLPKGKKAEYVTITIGGNDMHFADIVEKAAICGAVQRYLMLNWVYVYFVSCVNDTWTEYNSFIRSRIKSAYQNISETAGEQATILVAGYPNLFEVDDFLGGDSPVVASLDIPILSLKFFTMEEKLFINRNVHVFNEELRGIVEESQRGGMNIRFVPVEKHFIDRSLRLLRSHLLGIILGSMPEDLDSSGMVSHYSMHPNLEGAKAYAECVQEAIDTLEHQKLNLSEGERQYYVGWQTQYASFMENKEYYRNPDLHFMGEPSFALTDMNKDKIPELILRGGDWDTDIEYYIFTMRDNKVVYLGEIASHTGDGHYYKLCSLQNVEKWTFSNNESQTLSATYPGLFWLEEQFGSYWYDYYYISDSGQLKKIELEHGKGDALDSYDYTEDPIIQYLDPFKNWDRWVLKGWVSSWDNQLAALFPNQRIALMDKAAKTLRYQVLSQMHSKGPEFYDHDEGSVYYAFFG